MNGVCARTLPLLMGEEPLSNRFLEDGFGKSLSFGKSSFPDDEFWIYAQRPWLFNISDLNDLCDLKVTEKLKHLTLI